MYARSSLPIRGLQATTATATSGAPKVAVRRSLRDSHNPSIGQETSEAGFDDHRPTNRARISQGATLITEADDVTMGSEVQNGKT